ncbi:MAG: HAD family phosphatase, partial [Planctomycetes bacterium]|nr:HAD family phosphatase [Planctomycetota bacterium]
MIRTFLFDMGNVLVTFCHERMCRQIGNVCGLSVDEVRKNLIASGLQWKFERGDVCPDEFHSQWETFAATRISRESLSVAS